MAGKRKTNAQVVRDLMENSKHGALAQMFVIDALTKHAEMVSEADPKLFVNSLVHPQAWIGVATEIKQKLDAAYSRSAK